MMARFDDSDGKTPCWRCKMITPAGGIIALVQVEALGIEIQTCVELRCMMVASRVKGMGC